jgi:hypothetical protein
MPVDTETPNAALLTLWVGALMEEIEEMRCTDAIPVAASSYPLTDLTELNE